MIVHPDFPEHWKTKMLVDLTGDPSAPLKLIKLWAYCQYQKCCEFNNLTPDKIKAICGFEGDPAKIYHILKVKCGFLDEIERDGKVFVKVHDWDVHNSQLISSWENGAKGGRPKNQRKPTDNPPVTHGVTDKRREEKGTREGRERKKWRAREGFLSLSGTTHA